MSTSLDQTEWPAPSVGVRPALRPVALDTQVVGARPSSWKQRYVRSLVAGDAVAVTVATLGGLLLRFADDPGWLLGPGGQRVLWVALGIPVVWLLAMYGTRSYEHRFLWVGPEEFRRVLTASVWVLALIGTGSWAFKWSLARGFVCIALPLAALLTLVHRYLRRQALHRARRAGQHQQATLLVGHAGSVADLRARLGASPDHGLAVVGCCLPRGSVREGTFDGVPVLGSLDEVGAVVREHGIESVAVLPCPELDGAALRRLGWELEGTSAELLLAPAVTEFAGPRVAIRPVAGLPLMHVEQPELSGARRVAKTVVDVSLAALGLVLTSPLMLAVALAVKVTSPGPVFFVQSRVGLDGDLYKIFKFRTMVADAHAQEAQLFAGVDGLIKLKNDPRVTSVGRFLRKYSLDEMPQLFNVVLGTMSLVGPRPPQPHEASDYTDEVNRRFKVKPGMTGLWQVNGRSDLSWEDSVRMDMRYIENWSFGMDLYILWRTLGAVRRGHGAY